MAADPSPLKELTKVARAAESFRLESEFDLPGGGGLRVDLQGWRDARKWKGMISTALVPGEGSQVSHATASAAGEALRQVAADHPGAILRPGTVKVALPRGAMTSARAIPLAERAWHEAFGLPIPSPNELARRRKQARADKKAADRAIVALLATGAAGVAAFHRKTEEERATIDLRQADLSGLALDDIDFAGAGLEGADLSGTSLERARFGPWWARRLDKARFVGANLAHSELDGCHCADADFTRANLTGVQARLGSFLRANFSGATLAGANLRGADLRGADFTAAVLGDAVFDEARFDTATKWPEGTPAPALMVWKGEGADPRLAPTEDEVARPRPTDFAGFLDRLRQAADPAKLDKALGMLKADRFRLFAKVEGDHLVGVVKSQTSGDLVYSCRLAEDGSYACCTQNLNICGGLRGSPCKHLLVLVVGLAQAGELDPGTAHDWAQASRGRKAALDKDAMTETLLRYKGAEAGEVDWRPTETIPEDFFAM